MLSDDVCCEIRACSDAYFFHDFRDKRQITRGKLGRIRTQSLNVQPVLLMDMEGFVALE
jgi:hypothetical protein